VRHTLSLARIRGDAALPRCPRPTDDQ
jgi:hypothetical protein